MPETEAPKTNTSDPLTGPFVDVLVARFILLTQFDLDEDQCDQLLTAGLTDGSIDLFDFGGAEASLLVHEWCSNQLLAMIVVLKGRDYSIMENGVTVDGKQYVTVRFNGDQIERYADDYAYRHRKKDGAKRGTPIRIDWDAFDQEIEAIANGHLCPTSFRKLYQLTFDRLSSLRGMKKSADIWPKLSSAEYRYRGKFTEQIKAARS